MAQMRLTPAPPDRFRRGYAAALCKVSCYDVVVVLPEPAAGEAQAVGASSKLGASYEVPAPIG